MTRRSEARRFPLWMLESRRQKEILTAYSSPPMFSPSQAEQFRRSQIVPLIPSIRSSRQGFSLYGQEERLHKAKKCGRLSSRDRLPARTGSCGVPGKHGRPLRWRLFGDPGERKGRVHMTTQQRPPETETVIRPVRLVSVGEQEQAPAPLVRVMTCGLLTLEIAQERVSADPPRARYAVLTPDRLRGRGVGPEIGRA